MFFVFCKAPFSYHLPNRCSLGTAYAVLCCVTNAARFAWSAEQHLQGLAEWQEPRAGMFAWLKLCGGIQDADQILDKLKEEKVVVVPGNSWDCVL